MITTIFAIDIFQHPHNDYAVQIKKLFLQSFCLIILEEALNNRIDLFAVDGIHIYFIACIFLQYSLDDIPRQIMYIFFYHFKTVICIPKIILISGVFNMTNQCISNILPFVRIKTHFGFVISAKQFNSCFIIIKSAVKIIIKFCHRQIRCSIHCPRYRFQSINVLFFVNNCKKRIAKMFVFQ